MGRTKKPHPHAESRRGRGTLKGRQHQHQNSLLTLRASAESLKNEWHVAWQSYLQHAMSHVGKAGQPRWKICLTNKDQVPERIFFLQDEIFYAAWTGLQSYSESRCRKYFGML